MSKEKQIEEMAKVIDEFTEPLSSRDIHKAGFSEQFAEHIYNAGYRKQSEGEWTRFEVNGKNYGQVYYQHKECKVNETQLFPNPYKFCPNCGAKMKGKKWEE